MDGAPCITSRCVEVCMCFMCIGHCCSHHRLEAGISVNMWSSSLRAVTKGQPGTVVREVGPCTTVWAWPTLCACGRGHCFMAQVGMSLIAPEIGVVGGHGVELPIVLKPSM